MSRFSPEDKDTWLWSKAGHQLRSLNLCVGDFNYKVDGIKSQMRLSILVCTIPEREKDFEELWEHLARMWRGLPESHRRKVEIIAIRDNRKMTIGAKRNLLLNESCGEYVCFIDDDDWVSDLYMTKIMIATQKKPDAIGFYVKCENYPAPGKTKTASVGVLFNGWTETPDMIYRPPYHKTPVRREIALSALFPDKSYGEDADYSKRIQPYIHSVEFIPDSLYVYNAPVKPSQSRYAQK